MDLSGFRNTSCSELSLFWYGFKILFDAVSDFIVVKVLFYKGLQRILSRVEDIKESFRADLFSSEAFNLYLFICDVNDVFVGIWELDALYIFDWEWFVLDEGFREFYRNIWKGRFGEGRVDWEGSREGNLGWGEVVEWIWVGFVGSFLDGEWKYYCEEFINKSSNICKPSPFCQVI